MILAEGKLDALGGDLGCMLPEPIRDDKAEFRLVAVFTNIV